MLWDQGLTKRCMGRGACGDFVGEKKSSRAWVTTEPETQANFLVWVSSYASNTFFTLKQLRISLNTILCLYESRGSSSIKSSLLFQGVEKREPSYTVGGNANWYSHYGEQCGDCFKYWDWNCHMTQQSHCLAYTPRKPELKDICTAVFIAALCTIARTWKQPRWPLADERIRKWWYI